MGEPWYRTIGRLGLIALFTLVVESFVPVESSVARFAVAGAFFAAVFFVDRWWPWMKRQLPARFRGRMSKVSQYGLDRPFGRAIYARYVSQTPRLDSPTEPRIEFHYELINAELQDIEISGVEGTLTLDHEPIGSPALRPARVLQGALVHFTLLVKLADRTAQYVLTYRSDHPRSKDGSGILYEGDLWISAKGLSSNTESSEVKITSLPKLWND